MAKDTHGLRLVKAATGNGRFRLRARLWTMGWIQPVDKPLVRGPPGRCPAWFASARTRNATSRLAISPSRPPIGSPAPREWKRCRGPANAREEAATGQRAAGGGPLSSRCRPGRRHQDKRSMSRASPQCGATGEPGPHERPGPEKQCPPRRTGRSVFHPDGFAAAAITTLHDPPPCCKS